MEGTPKQTKKKTMYANMQCNMTDMHYINTCTLHVNIIIFIPFLSWRTIFSHMNGFPCIQEFNYVTIEMKVMLTIR